MSKKLGDTTKRVGNISAIVRLKDYAYDVVLSTVARLEDCRYGLVFSGCLINKQPVRIKPSPVVQ